MKVLTRRQKEEKLKLLREKRIRECRQSFWIYCKTMAPDFYREDRAHLRTLATTLQALYKGELLKSNGEAYKKLILNLPP